jgi:hypothetical protein
MGIFLFDPCQKIMTRMRLALKNGFSPQFMEFKHFFRIFVKGFLTGIFFPTAVRLTG